MGTGSAGPIVGAIINQTSTTITDLEIELSIITRSEKGVLKRKRDTRYIVVPSLNQTGLVTKLETNGDTYFSIPGAPYYDFTCPADWQSNLVPNVAAIAITRINGKSVLTVGKGGKLAKEAPLEAMLQVSRYAPERVPTQREVIEAVRQNNALLRATIISKQLEECLARGTGACTFNNNTNINVVISQR